MSDEIESIIFTVCIKTHSGKLYDDKTGFETIEEAESYAEEVRAGQHGPSAADVNLVSIYEH